MFRYQTLCVVLLAVWLSSPAWPQGGTVSLADQSSTEAADIVVWGGPIYTADDSNAQVEAVAIRDGRFIYVGNSADVQLLIGPDTSVLRLDQGAAAFPGFVDAHAHLLGVGLRELSLNLEGISSIEGLKDAVSVWRQDHPDDKVIVGRGWIETHWPENRFPSRFDLDRVVDDIPVILTRADGHALVANTAALEQAGITPATEAPFGGDILKNALGEPTGMLIDAAMALTDPVLPRMDDIRRQEALQLGARLYSQNGWTGMHNMSVSWADVDAIEALNRAGQMPIHVYNSVNQSDAPALFRTGPRQSRDGRILTRAIKLYVDGALGSRGAALLAPYSDDDSQGLVLIEKDTARTIMDQALQRGLQINMHAIGDRGNRLVLDWFEETFEAYTGTLSFEPRWRIEHAQIVHPDDIPRFDALGVIPSMQPSHAIGDLHFAPDRLGDARLDGAYAWKSLIDSGVIIAGGSDAPVERGDPIVEFFAAVFRHDLNGFQGENWRPQEAVSRVDALKMFTLWPAIASHMEGERGTIAVGKRADLSIFSADIMTVDMNRVKGTMAIATISDGTITYLRDQAPAIQ